jgi:hypothetical protein
MTYNVPRIAVRKPAVSGLMVDGTPLSSAHSSRGPPSTAINTINDARPRRASPRAASIIEMKTV